MTVLQERSAVGLPSESLKRGLTRALLLSERLSMGSLRGAFRLQLRRILQAPRLTLSMAGEATAAPIALYGRVFRRVQVALSAMSSELDVVQRAMARDAQGEIVGHVSAVGNVQPPVDLQPMGGSIRLQGGLDSDSGGGASRASPSNDFPCRVVDSVVFALGSRHSPIVPACLSDGPACLASARAQQAINQENQK